MIKMNFIFANQPSYFVTGLNLKNEWKAVILYNVTVKDLSFTPSDECIEIRFFSPNDARKEKLYPTVLSFIQEFEEANKV